MAGNESGLSYLDPSVMQQSLSPAEQALRDRFAEEYVLDYDAVGAAMRIGFMGTVARSYAQQLINEPYVAWKIQQLELEEQTDPKGFERRRKRAIEARLWKEAHGPTHSARVAALSKLCNMHGMDGPTKIKHDVTHRGGVMLVPAIASIEDWEKEALTSQQNLISEARH